ncbi:MAG: bifunctional alpha,alpha-trehalose-phosphate synthase (UDP-forming)/trehalose-phosphatase [Sedimentisphaerales bacterium]|nr:bifunctional alpha,alpha-trehalose-phosphate synthase (UDP-forming)/trehalose-phosphatase [Sedimentisphaerales bacterium]
MANGYPKSFDRLVLVSYRLPFQLFRNKVIRNAGGLVSAVLALAERPDVTGPSGQRIVWIGKTDDTPEELARVQEQVSEFDLVPVHIEDRLDDRYYGGFCNDMIWPLFHYFPMLTSFDVANFEAYRRAQELFLDKVAAILRPTDLVWVHDYHLLLLPGLIRERFPNANIGFFLHIPFPSFEIFRLIPRAWRETILRGILGADLAGFHTFDYTQYFLRAARRTLGVETTMNSAIVEDRLVKAETFPLGIDYRRYHEAAQDREARRERDKLDGILGESKLIFSVDRLDYSKGLLHRLLGYEHFLEKHPRWHGKIVFNMVVVPSRESIGRYQEMKKEIEATVGRINGKYGSLTWRPLVYQYQSLRFAKMVALYDRSDVGLITPIRDGMNLVAKEYLACQSTNPGVLILSEMAGAAAELSEAILINPTDKAEMADAIARALDMPLADRRIVLERMQRRLQNYDVFAWATDFFDMMDRVKQQQHVLEVRLMNRSIEREITQKYHAALCRIMFFDYDGTLVPFSRYPETAIPSEAVLERLKRLAEDPKNSVVVVSGRNREFLGQWFGGLPIDLVAEHGAFLRVRSAGWVSAVEGDVGWKEQVLPVLQRYADRCTGAFIEQKTLSLVWHYRNAESGIALLRSQELRDELQELVSRDSRLQIMEGHKVIEVKRSGYDKGSVASKLLAHAPYDFILAIGDDKTDEDLFRVLPAEALTIKIGITASLAKYNLKDQQGVVHLMDRLLDGSS